MPVDRPTFSESWYRVASLRPRLRPTVQSYRQHYRGQMWHVLQDPSNNQYSRLSEGAYGFVAMLDGRRTVAAVWQACNDQLGDAAPTQGEVIQLLGQLYTSNLLMAELSPDAQSLFRRYQKRVRQEVKSYAQNLLFARIPLLNPDRYLTKWVNVLGRVFTWYGGLAWIVLMVAALAFLAGRADRMVAASRSILAPSSLPLLYLSIVLVKIIHEFGHSFACKKFGLADGSGGRVHVMGIMFLVFTPLPYMDASSAWAFRSKWHRMVVGAAGILVDLAVAAGAAILWASAGEGTAVGGLAYRVMFVAGLSSLLFNGNPLLRFDAYFVLSDLLEIPNLAERSKQYLYYLVKRHVWSVRHARSPAHSRGERIWFVIYGVASSAYRIFIFAMILLFLRYRLPPEFAAVAFGFGLLAGITWLCIPAAKFVHYLVSSNELLRVRRRAVYSSLAVAVVVIAALGLIPVPVRPRAGGVVRPAEVSIVRAARDGAIISYLPSGTEVVPGDALVNGVLPVDKLLAHSPEQLTRLTEDQLRQLRPDLWKEVNRQLWTQFRHLLAQRNVLAAEHSKALSQSDRDPSYRALAQVLERGIRSADEEIAAVQAELALFVPRAKFAGTWVAPRIERMLGVYLLQANQMEIGRVISKEVMVRAVAEQHVPIDQANRGHVEIRVKGRPQDTFTGTITQILQAGKKELPSRALGYGAGGPVQTDSKDQQGFLASRNFHEVTIVPDPAPAGAVALLAQQNVIVRLEMPARPLASQLVRKILQVLQKRSASQ